jgi:aspartate dehydrogenase
MVSVKLGIIGCGAIGTDVALAADTMRDIGKIFLYDKKAEAAEKLCKHVHKGELKTVEAFLDRVDIIFEAASQEAVYEFAEDIINAGKNLIIMSVGSLFDDKFRERLVKTAQVKKCKIYLPSGAVCGIDGINAARIGGLDEVTLVTTKNPAALNENLTTRTVIFEGNAREAVKEFSKNINVAGCLSLAGVGFDKTNVKIVADPVVKSNSHRILAYGKFGRLRAETENLPNPNNPSSSLLASLSAIATLRRALDPIQIGA